MKQLTYSIQGKRIKVNSSKNIFLPHPDTILLANSLKIKKGEIVCDLGIGSGLLAITAAKLGAKQVYGVDINKTAVKASKKNARLNHVEKKCIFKNGSWFQPFGKQKFNVIVTNPPQIPGDGKSEKSFFRIATEGGKDGTKQTLSILLNAQKYLTQNGRIYFPLKEWMDWKKVLKKAKQNYSCKIIDSTFSPLWTNDLFRINRVLELVKKGKARFKIKNEIRYYKIYSVECTLKSRK